MPNNLLMFLEVSTVDQQKKFIEQLDMLGDPDFDELLKVLRSFVQ